MSTKPATHSVKNRILSLERVPARELIPHPLNPRQHPPAQREALAASFEALGIADRILAYRTPQGLQIIDGHLRAETLPDEELPVLVTDLTEAEARLMLQVADPLAMLAITDGDVLARLREASEEDRLAGLIAPGPGLDELLGRKAGESEGEEQVPSASLAERFGVPPFSVLDARQGYWQDRKRAWLALGIQSELGRGDCMPSGASSVYAGSSAWCDARGGQRASASPGGSPRPAASLGADGKTVRGDGRAAPLTPGQQGGRTDLFATAGQAQRSRYAEKNRASNLGRRVGQDLMRGEHTVGIRGAERAPEGEYDYPVEALQAQSGTSIFDPVLCELAYRWFCPEGGAVLDPFAGGSVRGIVAAKLGRRYLGIDLSERQLAANEEQAAAICGEVWPCWRVGDSRNVGEIAPGEYDFIFSCPPYADLEVYSDDPRDLSTLDYPAFLAAYRAIIAGCCAMLRENRFVCFCVGDVRDGRGFYRNFVSDTIAAFQDAGLRLYNEAILVTAVGSLPIRVGRQFGSYRKLGKTHQNVLVFYKGDTAKIGEIAADCQFGAVEPEEETGALP